MKSQVTPATKLTHSLQPLLELFVLPLLQQRLYYVSVEHSLHNAVHSKVYCIRLGPAIKLLSVHSVNELVKLHL
jgi:hypothetical protein